MKTKYSFTDWIWISLSFISIIGIPACLITAFTINWKMAGVILAPIISPILIAVIHTHYRIKFPVTIIDSIIIPTIFAETQRNEILLELKRINRRKK